MTRPAPALWHVSDDPRIQVFNPHRAPTARSDEKLVWAVDEPHLPAYWFPRDCPRATFWIGPRTSQADIAWMNGSTRVHAIEWDWWDRFRKARVYLYRMPVASFTVQAPEAGYWVSHETVEPLDRVELDDLVRAHAESRIELRLVDNLWPLWDRVVASTLEFSGIRLRNAQPPAGASAAFGLLPR